MPKGERRQGGARPIRVPDQCRQETPSSGLRQILATAFSPDCAGEIRRPLFERSHGMSHDKLAYAVRKAKESEECASDEMLLKSIAEGDKAAMHIMFARHRARVFRFIQRIVRNTAIAEDLVSQVFLDVWRSANAFESRSRVSTWLLSIARLKALSSFRERRHENIDRDDVLGIVDVADTPEAALDRKETNGVLRACIGKLSPAHRDVIDLFYYREKSVAEMSEIFGIPHATVKSRIFYARKQLAGMLVSAGFEAAPVRTNDHRATEAGASRGLKLTLQVGLSAI